MKKNSLKALISLLDDPDREIYEHVEQKILSMGEAVVPLLEEEWEKNPEEAVQKRIEELIEALHFQSIRKDFRRWLESENEDLLKGLWITARLNSPLLRLESLSAKLSQMYHELWTFFSPSLTPFEQIKTLNHYLFNIQKFEANSRDFHSPSNSFIDRVLEEKKGNPISLCSIYMLLAQRFNMPVFGTNFPNLFLLQYRDETKKKDFYINVFNRGIIFRKKDLEAYIEQLPVESSESFFEPCSALDIVRRNLANLKYAYSQKNNLAKRDQVDELLRIVNR
ncbi:MAG: transglutaminase-like domain-containing protein [Cytophagales bacterium]|nr:transglutaminase-like domain-containing protein [Cytophagales bacterium]